MMSEPSNAILKIPFDYGLFFCAVTNLLGEPVRKTDLMNRKSFCDWYWEIPKDKTKKKEFNSVLPDIVKWMKYFDIDFPESRCDIAKWETSPKPNITYLRITIVYNRPKVETV